MELLQDEGLSFDDVSLVPQKSDIGSRHNVDLTTGEHFGFTLDLPILSANMETVTGPRMVKTLSNLGCLGFLHRFQDEETLERYLDMIGPMTRVVTSVGVDNFSWRICKAWDHNKNLVCIDVAHGHHNKVLVAIKEIKEAYEGYFTIVAGNVCTAKATLELFDAGADLVKVGVGPGSHCTTRVVTGHGVPQLSAVMECAEVAESYAPPHIRRGAAFDKLPPPKGIIADGGIRHSGDIAKALAAGADYVMIGKLLAGCDESPAECVSRPGGFKKIYRGSASYEAQKGKRSDEYIISEGVQSEVPYCGSARDVVTKLANGLRSALSYSGARNLREFREKAVLRRVTPGSHVEGTPHGAF